MTKTTLMKGFLITLTGLTIGAAGLFCWQSSSREKAEPDKRQESPRHRVQITGFRFDGHRGEKRVLTIRADQFTIEKGKMGPLRVGLWNVAKLKNGIIDLYGSSSPTTSLPGAGIESVQKDTTENPGVRKLELNDVFQGEAIPSFGVKKISSIILEPIHLVLHDEVSVVSEISAAYATVRVKERDIILKGSVRVVSGQRTLVAGTLSLDPLKGILRSEDQVFVNGSRGAIEQKGIVTDFFLNEMNQL